MKKLIEMGNRFAQESDWKDFALTKFCLLAMGIILGLFIPASSKTPVLTVSLIVFVITYVILMRKVFIVCKKMKEEAK